MNKVDAMNKKLKRIKNRLYEDKDDAPYMAVLSKDIASVPQKSTFFDVFSEVHSAPEDVDSVKFPYEHMGRSEDRRKIRKYFEKAISDLGMRVTRTRQ